MIQGGLGEPKMPYERYKKRAKSKMKNEHENGKNPGYVLLRFAQFWGETCVCVVGGSGRSFSLGMNTKKQKSTVKQTTLSLPSHVETWPGK